MTRGRVSGDSTVRPMQCAWCGRLYDRHGLTSGATRRSLDAGMSHGICHRCLDALYHKKERSQRDAGDLGSALLTLRQRVGTLAQLASARCEERSRRTWASCERSWAFLAESHSVLRTTGTRRVVAACRE